MTVSAKIVGAGEPFRGSQAEVRQMQSEKKTEAKQERACSMLMRRLLLTCDLTRKCNVGLHSCRKKNMF